MADTKLNRIRFPAGDDDYRAARLRCAMACQAYNRMPENATVEFRSRLWRGIVTTGSMTPPCEDELEEAAAGRDTNPASNNPFSRGAPYVKPPVHVDYGTNLQIGASTFINRNFTVCDTPILPVTVGERCLIGPNTSVYAVGHPLDYRERAGPMGAPSIASPVAIEDDCWVGGNVIIMPGVRIGKGCVIGAGSVVTKDVPPEHLAYGNPARVIRRVTDDAAESEGGPPGWQIPSTHMRLDSDAAAAAKIDPTVTSHLAGSPRPFRTDCACSRSPVSASMLSDPERSLVARGRDLPSSWAILLLLLLLPLPLLVLLVVSGRLALRAQI